MLQYAGCIVVTDDTRSEVIYCRSNSVSIILRAGLIVLLTFFFENMKIELRHFKNYENHLKQDSKLLNMNT